jgi:hypothetical protein
MRLSRVFRLIVVDNGAILRLKAFWIGSPASGGTE